MNFQNELFTAFIAYGSVLAICLGGPFCSFADGPSADIILLDKKAEYPQVFEQALANPEVPYLMYFLADYLYHGRKGIEAKQLEGRDYYQKAIPLLLPLAQGGDANAQYFLGRCYEYGQNDYPAARKWYIKAADNGNSDAMCKAAMFIAKRRGDNRKAPELVMAYIQKAIAAGNPDGTALLSSYYLEGRKDIPKGVKLAKEAAEAGSALGQMILAELYLRGMGDLPQDNAKALELLQAASDQGNSQAHGTLTRLQNEINGKIASPNTP